MKNREQSSGATEGKSSQEAKQNRQNQSLCDINDVSLSRSRVGVKIGVSKNKRFAVDAEGYNSRRGGAQNGDPKSVGEIMRVALKHILKRL